MAEHQRSLLRSWAAVYAIGACVLPDRSECWTSARLDGTGIITAGDWVTLGVLIREDHGCYPQRRKLQRPDYLLAQCRRDHPGFAVIGTAAGFQAFRCGRSWEARRVQALSCLLAGQEAADAREAARAGRP